MYQTMFKFFETAEQAERFCDSCNKSATAYIRKHHPAHFTPWQSGSPTDTAHFVAWYYSK